MRQFIDVTGKTEDEAIQNALRQLGLDRDDVSVEILERAKSGFLGLGSCPAKVRVSYGPEEEEEVLAPAPAPKEKPQEERPKPPKAEKPPRQERKPAEAPAPAPEEKTRQSAPVQTLGEEVDDEKAQAIRKFLSGLLEQMESAAEIHIYLLEKGRYKVILEGKNLGALIGRRGETLDAIQQLTSYAVNRSGIIDLGVIVMFAYNLCAGLLRAIGNSFMPLVFLILSSVLNVILDLWFIAVLGMGVAGAGVATVISQGVSVALCILYVFRSARLLLPGKKHFHVESRLYWELFSQSISMGLMSSIVSAGSVVLQYGINGLGTLVIAGHTAARKLFAFTDMPLSAMASACSTYVSQNYGANHPDRVRRGMRDIYLYSVVVAVAAVLLMAAGAEWMVKLVSGSSEPVVLENGARYLVWNAPFYAVLGMLLSTRYALQSMGEKVLPLLSSVIEFLGKIVFVLLFIPRFEYNAVILCEPVIWCFMTIELLIAYRHDSFVFPKKK